MTPSHLMFCLKKMLSTRIWCDHKMLNHISIFLLNVVMNPQKSSMKDIEIKLFSSIFLFFIVVLEKIHPVVEKLLGSIYKTL